MEKTFDVPSIMTSNKSLLTELKYFVNGVANLHRGLPADVNTQLVKCSLTLLEELSTSREVILEYFAMIFDESVKNYIAYEVSWLARIHTSTLNVIVQTFFFLP